MAYSYWNALVFVPPVIVFVFLTGYDRWVLGVKLPEERKALQDYSKAEIVYALFVAFVVLGNFFGGIYLLDQFEPVNTILCVIYLLVLSLPLTGGVLGYYSEVRFKKKVGFQAVIFCLFLLPTLLVITGFAYNGFADTMPSHGVSVMVIDKRIQINKGGGTPLIKLQPIDKSKEEFGWPKEKEVSKISYERIEIGDRARLTIKSGALGIPWIEKLMSHESRVW